MKPDYKNWIPKVLLFSLIAGTALSLALLLETLRVLKKGGCFAIHDLMSPRRYGDMQAFVNKLTGMGYECVELIDTTDGRFMSKKEAAHIMLRGSTLLVGKK